MTRPNRRKGYPNAVAEPLPTFYDSLMARWRMWTGASMDWPREAAEAPPRDQDRRRGLRWPIPAQRVVRIKDPERPYFVDVEICVFDPEEGAVVTGICIRTGSPLDPKAS